MTSTAWVTCDGWITYDGVKVEHWESVACHNPIPVHKELPKCYDELLGCVVNEAAPPVPSQGEKY